MNQVKVKVKVSSDDCRSAGSSVTRLDVIHLMSQQISGHFQSDCHHTTAVEHAVWSADAVCWLVKPSWAAQRALVTLPTQLEVTKPVTENALQLSHGK